MKNLLLSSLAVVLTLFGCQSYDDQLDDINKIIKQQLELSLSNARSFDIPIKITNPSQLGYFEGELALEKDPRKLKLTSSLYIDLISNEEMKGQEILARVNAITERVLLVSTGLTIKSLTLVDLSSLFVINGSLSIEGKIPTLSSLTSVSSDIIIDGSKVPTKFEYSIPSLSEVDGNIRLTSTDSATAIDFSGVTGGGAIFTGGGTFSRVLEFNEVTSVKLGGLGFASKVVLPKGKTFTGTAEAYAPPVRIDLEIFLGGEGSTVSFPNLESLRIGTVSATVDNFDLPKLERLDGSLTVSKVTSLSFPKLKTVSGTVTAITVTEFNAPILTPSRKITLIPSGAEVTLASIGESELDGSVRELTLTKVAPGESSIGSDYDKLTTLSITGGGDAKFSVSGTVSLTSFTSAGELGVLVLTDLDKLTSLDLGHSYPEKGDKGEVSITGCASLTAVDLAELSRVREITISDNPSLSSITAPASEDLAPSNSEISIVIKSNKLSGVYTAATSQTSYVAPKLVSGDLAGFKSFIEAYGKQEGRAAATGNPATASVISGLAYNLVVDDVDPTDAVKSLTAALDDDDIAQTGKDSDNDGAAAADSGKGSGINTQNELNIVSGS